MVFSKRQDSGKLVLLFSGLFIFGFFLKVFAGENVPLKLMIVHSYDESDLCGKPQEYGIFSYLAEEGYHPSKNLDVRVFFMDTKKTFTTPEEIEERGRLAIKEVERFSPDILVVLDDDGFRTVGLYFAGKPVAVVFSGLNGQPEYYNAMVKFMETREKPGHNITGVYEYLHVSDALKVHAKMFPETKKILFITDTSYLGNVVRDQIFEELSRYNDLLCQWELRSVDSWEGYTELIKKASEDPSVGALYPAVLKLTDRSGKKYAPDKIIEWTIANSKKPELALNVQFAKMGYFGGAAVDFFQMGRQAGRMVVRIARGEMPGNIAIEKAEKFILVFNLVRAAELGLKMPDEFIMAADEVITGKIDQR